MYGQANDRKNNNNRQFQEASAQKKAMSDTQYFWDLVNRNQTNGFPSMNSKRVNKSHEEKLLFGKKTETTEHGFIDDNIPVERSGPRSAEIPVLQSFNELDGKVPQFMMNCIKLMGYEKPTPIQKHAVPLGLAGVDLMCCAQTVSGL